MTEFVKVPMALWARLLECAEVADKVADADMSASGEAGGEYVFGPWVSAVDLEGVPKGNFESKDRDGHIWPVGAEWAFVPCSPADRDRNDTVTYRRTYRIGDWQTHDGGPCPVPPETLIEIGDRWAHGMVARAGSMAWSHCGTSDITQWRVIAKSARQMERDYFDLGAEV